jgi:hypothetical protein
MRIHVELFDANGVRERDETFESPRLTIGRGEEDDFALPAVREAGIVVEVDGRALVVDAGPGQVVRIESATVLDLGRCKLRITPYPPATRVDDGACPKCAVPVRETEVGGAYRTMARRERACPRCRGALVDLDGTVTAIGAFADASGHDWVHVTAALLCPHCGRAMTRARFSTSRGQADVERCEPCRLVFLEEDDRARLRGEA